MPQEMIADVSTAAARTPSRQDPAPSLVPALTLISHPSLHRAGERLVLEGLLSGREVALSRNGPDFTRPGSVLGLPLGDPYLSRKPLVFAPAPGGGLRLSAEEGGTRVVADEPLQGTWELSPEQLAAGVPLELAGRMVLLLHLAPRGLGPPGNTLGMVGESAGVRRVRQYVERIADLNVPVLIRGETGTGKELVARAIHDHSPRRKGPFVSVNLGAVPRELAAAELFGAERGAYTGATREREGFFRAAQGGTLFLDEVGEAPPEVQVMLLRVLETGELFPVGASTPVRTDTRIIAATDANLEEHIRDGRFKAPLLHRLAGYEIRLPPLRERREDLGVLFHHFAREELEALGEAHRLAPGDPYAEPWLPASLASHLVRYAWPGNIRQLRNVTRQLVIGSRGQPTLQADPQLVRDLGADALRLPRPLPLQAEESRARPAAPRRRPSEVTETELLAALRECAWDLKAAGDRLGIPRSSIYDLIERSPHIRTAGDLDNAEITRCFDACGGDLDTMVQRLEVSKRALARRLKELGLSAKGG
jgi:two-component system nitrogen regulation response regulator GlnG